MIKFPVKVGTNDNELTGEVEVLDSTGLDIITCDTLEIAEAVVNALNAMFEFPDEETLMDEKWEIDEGTHHWLARWCQKFPKKENK